MLKKLFGAKTQLSVLGQLLLEAWSAFTHYPRVSWQLCGTQDSLSNSHFAPNSLSLTQRMGPTSEEGRAVELCSSSFPSFLWSNKVTVTAAWVSVIPWFRGSKPRRGSQRNCDLEITKKKNNFQDFSSVFRNRRHFRSDEKVHCWGKKNHIKPETQKLILKSFLCFTEQFALKCLLFKKKVI